MSPASPSDGLFALMGMSLLYNPLSPIDGKVHTTLTLILTFFPCCHGGNCDCANRLGYHVFSGSADTIVIPLPNASSSSSSGSSGSGPIVLSSDSEAQAQAQVQSTLILILNHVALTLVISLSKKSKQSLINVF